MRNDRLFLVKSRNAGLKAYNECLEFVESVHFAESSNRIQKAIVYATQKHAGQTRKGGNIPYIVHPMEVMQILSSMGCSDNVIIAGILHDTLEDTNATPEEIKELFGAEVLEIVEHESEDKSKTWKERKQHTIDTLKNAPQEVRLVCFADKLSNMRAMWQDLNNVGEKLWDRFNAGKKDIAWYYKSVADVLKCTELNGEAMLSVNPRMTWKLFKELELYIKLVFEG